MSQSIPDLNLPNGIHIPADQVRRFLWGGVESGVGWLKNLPELLDTLCQLHNITHLRTSPEMRMNLVLFGESATHGPVVLKMAQPNHFVTDEITCLRVMSRTGRYAMLIDANESAGWSLQQRVAPGEMLQTFAQTGEIADDEATRITARLMQETIQPVPTNVTHQFPDLNRWLKSLWDYAKSDKDIIPADQVELALRHARHLVANPEPPMLLHGDFHHGNILSSERGWTMIDPKGIVAENGFEVGPFFYNPIGIDKRPNLVELFDVRLGIFSEELGIDRVRLWRNVLVGCVLSDCWTLEDGIAQHCHFDTVTAALMQLPERNA